MRLDVYTCGSIKLFDHGVLVGVILADFIGSYQFVTLRTASSTFGATFATSTFTSLGGDPSFKRVVMDQRFNKGKEQFRDRREDQNQGRQFFLSIVTEERLWQHLV
jgi:hypothetical protein